MMNKKIYISIIILFLISISNLFAQNLRESLIDSLFSNQISSPQERINIGNQLLKNPRLIIEKEADLYMIMAESYQDLKNKNQAIKYYNKAKKKYKDNKNLKGLATLLNKMSLLYGTSENIQKEKESSLQYREEIGVKKGLSAYLELSDRLSISSDTLKTNPKIIKALTLLEESKRIAEEYDYRDVILENYQNFSNIFSIKGDYKEALRYYKLYHEIRDSIVDEALNTRILEMKVKYETEKKEKELELLKANEKNQNLQIRNQKILIYSLIVISILVIVIAMILYKLYRTKQKAITLLNQKNKELRVINKELEKSEHALSNSNAIKDKFFNIITFSLKNSINDFLANSQFLNQQFKYMEEDEIREAVVDINNSSSNLYSLLENLVQWSKSQTGVIEFEKQKVDISEIVWHNVFHFKKSAEIKNIEIKNQVQPETYVWADMESLIIVMGNLISNAVKFGNESGSIDITSEINEHEIITSVIDNGIGFSDEEASKIFIETLSTKPLKEDSEEGIGLGLVISKEFIEKNKGRIWYEKNEDKGSIFKFALPKYKEEE